MNRLSSWNCAGHIGALWATGCIGAVVFFVGLWWHDAGLAGGGAAVLCLVSYAVGERMGQQAALAHHDGQMGGPSGRSESASLNVVPRTHALPPRTLITSGCRDLPRTSSALVDDLLGTGRYALLLRRGTKEHLSQAQVIQAIRQLDEAMSLVPAGRVLLGQLAEQVAASGGVDELNPQTVQRNLVSVEPVYLDRFAVSNEQFQQFVDAGGYERLEYWHEEALPALLDFVDHTDQPGPRYWFDGHFPPGGEYLPAVGVSWYEAWAYARWVGKRLPTDAQWTKAGAWPVESSPGRIAQRRYPWGESFDLRRANLWASGRHQPGDVDEFPGGVSVGGIHQLVGNVWEWTDSALCLAVDRSYHVPDTYKSIRGGAFDTYFESQATCHFESGEHPLARRRNIGFRLALPMADLDATAANDSDNAVAGADEETPVDAAPQAEDAQCENEVEVTC
jgi:iron(II)-dependent oxidoreductase